MVHPRLDLDPMPTSWYWNEVIGTMLPPIVPAVLNVVTGTGTLSPMWRFAFSPSVIRTCGLASSCASLFVFTKS